MSKTTKITFAPDDGVGGQITQRHHHVQTDEDLDPPHLPNNHSFSGHNHHHPTSSNANTTAARTINGYLLMERLEKLELGQDRLSSIISDLTSAINDLNFNLRDSKDAFPPSNKCHKSISTQSDTGVQTEEDLFSSSEIREKEKEILKLKKELVKLSHHQKHLESQSKPLTVKKVAKETSEQEEDKGGATEGAPDYDSDSPLNLFIECFKKKYDVAVHPNDVAIFV